MYDMDTRLFSRRDILETLSELDFDAKTYEVLTFVSNLTGMSEDAIMKELLKEEKEKYL